MDQPIKTWSEAVEYTFKTRDTWRHGKGAKTMRFNTNHITRIAGPSFPIECIKLAVVNNWCIELEEEGKADSTINRIVSAISTVLNHLHKHELIDSVPKFETRKEEETRPFFYTKENVERMVELSSSVYERHDLSDLMLFAGYTGMRMGEIMRIRKQDIDVSSNTIHVGGVPTQTTKSKNYRAIPIAERIEKLVYKRIAHSSSDESKLFGHEWKGSRQADSVRRPLKKVLKMVPLDTDLVDGRKWTRC